MYHIKFCSFFLRPVLKLLNWLSPVGDLLARIWIAKIFFLSALTKVHSWQSTLMLFKYEYHVPLLTPAFAAYLGTGLEFLLPILLVLGLGGRFFIFVFFIYNILCVVSFHFLWTPAGQVGLNNHANWGLLLMLLMFHGSGKLSLDHLIHKKWGHHIHGNKTK